MTRSEGGDGRAAPGCTDCGLGRSIHAGGGFLDFETRAIVPAACAERRRLVTIDAKADPPYRCPLRGCIAEPVLMRELLGPLARWPDHVVFSWLLDEEQGRQHLLRDIAFPCPRCRQPELRFGAPAAGTAVLVGSAGGELPRDHGGRAVLPDEPERLGPREADEPLGLGAYPGGPGPLERVR